MTDQPNTTHRVAVIGGGLAGLTASAHLAKAGHSVVLIERNADPGGRARTDNLDGWLFNQGAHALYQNGVGHTELKQLGIDPAGEPPVIKRGRLATNGTTTRLPIDPAGIVGCKALGAAGKAQYAKLMAGLAKLRPSDFANVSVSDWLSPYRPDVAGVIASLVRLSTYAAAHDILSADAAISQLQSPDGVLYLHGGWASMCAEISAIGVSHGASIITGSRVSSITASANGYTIETDDRRFEVAAVIVAAGGPDLTARLLSISPAVFGDIGPAPEAAVLDFALDRLPTHRLVLGLDEPTYFSVHSPPARMAPDAMIAAVAMRYIAPDDDGSADEHRRSLEAVAALAEIGEPVRTRFLRRMTVTNGLPIAAAGGMAGRPNIAAAALDNVFVAGDWVGQRGLLADAAIASGADAARAAAKAIEGMTRSTSTTVA